MSLQETVTAEFSRIYGTQPTHVVRAPGRVNLIGEHTDYNDGFVLLIAIDRAAWIALRPRTDKTVNVYSSYFEQSISFSLEDFETAKDGWIEYLRGVAWVLKGDGYPLTGWDGVVASDVPVGAGLSSSAAIW